MQMAEFAFLKDFDFTPLWLSFEVAGKAILLGVPISFVLALQGVLTKKNWVRFFDFLVLFPMLLPPTVTGYLLLRVVNSTSPTGKLYLHLFGESLIFSPNGAALAAFTVSFPLLYFGIKAAFSQIDENLILIAKSLGANSITIARKVIIPTCTPALGIATALGFARCLGEFGATLMVAGNIPGFTQTMPAALYFSLEAGNTRQTNFWCFALLACSTWVVALVSLMKKKQSQANFLSYVKDSYSNDVFRLPSKEADSLQAGIVAQKQIRVDFALRAEIKSSEKSMPPAGKLELNYRCQFNPGINAIVGESGAGKSLLLKAIAGAISPTIGSIHINGMVVYHRKNTTTKIDIEPAARHIGYVEQRPLLFSNLNVQENIFFGLRPSTTTVNKQMGRKLRQSAHLSIELLRLQPLLGKMPSELSGGQQQRVSLARALAASPQVLLLDEPFSSFDTALKTTLLCDLKEALRALKVTTLLVTHDTAEATALADEIFLMSNGSLRSVGCPNSFHSDPQHFEHFKFLSQTNHFALQSAADNFLVSEIDWHIGKRELAASTRCFLNGNSASFNDLLLWKEHYPAGSLQVGFLPWQCFFHGGSLRSEESTNRQIAPKPSLAVTTQIQGTGASGKLNLPPPLSVFRPAKVAAVSQFGFSMQLLLRIEGSQSIVCAYQNADIPAPNVGDSGQFCFFGHPFIFAL